MSVNLKYALPLILFSMLLIFLWRGLSINPHQLPSALIGHPVPRFHLSTLSGKTTPFFSERDLQGTISLVNVWATWCSVCRDEHPVLMNISHRYRIPIYAIDYKDNRQSAQQWLQLNGNPFQKIGFDQTGSVAIDWGVYGTPETFLIDKKGIIRFKWVGAMTSDVWQNKFMPLIARLEQPA